MLMRNWSSDKAHMIEENGGPTTKKYEVMMHLGCDTSRTRLRNISIQPRQVSAMGTIL